MSDLFFQNLMYFNNSKILAGISIVLMNIGSRYIISDLGIIHNKILSSEIFKKIIIFAMFFVATRDILIAFMLAISYVIIVDGILHEKRKFCIVPKKYIEQEQKNISEQEYLKAKNIIIKYDSQNKKEKEIVNSEENYINTYDIYKNNLNILNTNANIKNK
jgi:ABC-type multidrug transport system fused ATPase/permease subunit